MKPRQLCLAIVFGATLAACSATGPDDGTKTGSVAPPPDDSLPAAAPQSLNSGGTYPYGAAMGSAGESQAPDTADDPSPLLYEGSAEPTSGELVVKAPDGTVWRKVGIDEEEHLADVESCYRAATAAARRDVQIYDDRNAALDTLTSDSVLSAQRRSLEKYNYERDRGKLLTQCLELRGYSRL